MTYVSAADLRIGMQTPGGLTVTEKTSHGDLHSVTWNGYHEGSKAHTTTYHASQSFEIAREGATERGTNMAQRVITSVESDLSGDADASNVTFGLDGVSYAIDLTDAEAGALREALAPYVGAGRPLKGGKRRATQQPQGPSAKDVRAWAQENGHTVPDRGRIPAEVREAYEAAHAA